MAKKINNKEINTISGASIKLKLSTEEQISECYKMLKNEWKKSLELAGVKLPELRDKSQKIYHKNALTLVFLYFSSCLNKCKSNQLLLQKFITHWTKNPGEVSGIQRGLYTMGWNISSGKRGGETAEEIGLKTSEYFLTMDVNNRFSIQRRDTTNLNFDEIKKLYDHRCATCGSKEGEYIFNDPGRICKLQKGHMIPSESMQDRNIIPQCQYCNEQYQNKFIFNKSGRIIGLASECAIDNNTPVEVKRKILLKLKKELK